MDKDIDHADKCGEWLASVKYSSAGNIFGEPQKTTRFGDEYQAQIPSFSTEMQLTQFQNQFEFGLPIPVTWVQNHHMNKEETMEIQENDMLPLPCSSFQECWSAIEHESFVLGLYIFGKNLRFVNKFMGDKGLPNVISYYYGKFYRTKEHQKWSIYRKARKRKCFPGRKIFIGWRLQELLSRLLPDVADECKASMNQVIKTFEEGRLSFEKCVFALRDTTGVDLLIKAVAIGKGKQDLTARRRNRGKTKKAESKCASLKTEEIVNILNDRIGLSTTRLNEFFWAALWPRLLERGWHSEQPRKYAIQNSKNLVFLAPGVTKFSRRSLVKGSQYFDSLIEVLNKVSAEPHLLDLKTDQDPLVKPHASHGSDEEQDLMKCPDADTSLAGPVKTSDVTSLSFSEPTDTRATSSISGETECNTTKDPGNKMELAPDAPPVRKLKFVFKRNTKRQRVDNEAEVMEPTRPVTDLINPQVGPGSEAVASDTTTKRNTKRQRVDNKDEVMEPTRPVIDLINPRVGPGSEAVLPGTSTNPADVLIPNGQRKSSRSRVLTTKALEALANESVNLKKKAETEDGTGKRVRAKTAPVWSCGARYLADGVFDGSSCRVTESPKVTKGSDHK